MKRIKIKDARVLLNIMFQEDQEMFHRKTQVMKQQKERYLKWKNLKSSGQESEKTRPKTHCENG